MNKSDGYREFQDITRSVLLCDGCIDWSFIEKTSLGSMLFQMKRTYQNPIYHGEIDVCTHTKMVCEEIIKQPEYKNGSEIDKTVLFWAAILHDIGKIKCTVEVDGELKSPNHTVKGAIMARAMLWQDFGLCGDVERQKIREAICLLIRYHSFPPYAVTYKDVEYRLLKIATNGELTEYFSIEKLCALERADMLGRIYDRVGESLDKIEYCRELAAEVGCLYGAYEFTDDFSKRAYFKEKTLWKDQKLFNDSWGSVILMSGLPGTGKDSYINEHYSDIPMLSLDEIRKELKISPQDNQGAVVALAHERAREYLRKKQPFVWNATNLVAKTRTGQISLFENYGASVKIIFLETDVKTQIERNSSRKEVVPASAISDMFSKLTLPERYESESVLWKIT